MELEVGKVKMGKKQEVLITFIHEQLPPGCVPGSRRGTLPESLDIILTTAPGLQFYCPCFTDKEAEAQRG